jgi:hypothetical protein
MFTRTSRSRCRVPFVTVLTLAAAVSTGFAAGADPALALCKYGTPHCVNPNPGPKLPKIGGAQLPDSGWEDPDCQYYHNCGYASSAARQLPTGLKSTGTLRFR